MTWAQDQRIAYIKSEIEAGRPVRRPEVAARFNCTIQTISATFRHFEARHPGLMAYDGRSKAYLRADLTAESAGLSWRDRALKAEAEVARLNEQIAYLGHAQPPGPTMPPVQPAARVA